MEHSTSFKHVAIESEQAVDEQVCCSDLTWLGSCAVKHSASFTHVAMESEPAADEHVTGVMLCEALLIGETAEGTT